MAAHAYEQYEREFEAGVGEGVCTRSNRAQDESHTVDQLFLWPNI